MIRAIIFDIGGVLWRAGDLTVHRQWEKRLSLPEGQLAEIIVSSPSSAKATIGQATLDDVWQEVKNRFALSSVEMERLKVDFWTGGVWDTDLLAFIRSLRSRFKMGTISDAWPGAREAVKDYVNNDLFDVSLFSAEEGIQKPDPEIYLRALTRLGVKPHEAVFTDDNLPNVEGARSLGMAGIHFIDPTQTRQEIERLIRS